ncbi:hypothetical protein GQX73_g4566 [Xylaria multiplex]|uniref:Aflatoxin regulatory protein domain-containing protein n=1 Tax=Xylaria multiplex TaxID=323545 RepID=A0A7C8N879_9PEZI|nr:hypothetical protein GQX73_g4566 [Xylaria multiplex]
MADSSKHESTESVTEYSNFPSVNYDTSPWGYSDSIKETIGLEPLLQKNEEDDILSIGMDLDSRLFPAFDSSMGAGGAGGGSLPLIPLASIKDDINEEFPSPKQSLFTQTPALPDSVMDDAESTGEGQYQLAHMLGEAQSLDAKTSLRPCECWADLACSLLNWDLWDATGAVSSANTLPALNIEAYLSLFSDSMNAWDRARSCHLSCAVRHEAALLFILSLNRVVAAQLRLITKLSCMEPCDKSSLAGEDGIRIGEILIDNTLDRVSMLRELIRSQIGRLAAAIQTFREEWMGAGLNVYCAKLDLILSNLESQVLPSIRP